MTEDGGVSEGVGMFLQNVLFQFLSEGCVPGMIRKTLAGLVLGVIVVSASGCGGDGTSDVATGSSSAASKAAQARTSSPVAVQPGVTPPLEVAGVLAPTKDDELVAALREAADTGVFVEVGVHIARAQAPAVADGKTVTLLPDTGANPVYAIAVDDHYHQCSQPELEYPDFHMCQTVSVKRDLGVAAELSEPQRSSIGQDSFALTTVGGTVEPDNRASDSADFTDLQEADSMYYTANDATLRGVRFETPDGKTGCVLAPTQRWCAPTGQLDWKADDVCADGSPLPSASPTAIGWLSVNDPACHWAFSSGTFLTKGDGGQWNYPLAALPYGSKVSATLSWDNPSDRITCGSRVSGLTCVHETDGTGFTVAEGTYATFTR